LQQKYDQFHVTTALWKKWGKEKPKDCRCLQIPANRKQAFGFLWGVAHVTVGILKKAW